MNVLPVGFPPSLYYSTLKYSPVCASLPVCFTVLYRTVHLDVVQSEQHGLNLVTSYSESDSDLKAVLTGLRLNVHYRFFKNV